MLEDWLGCFESMLLGGIELQREPLDGAMNAPGGFSGWYVILLTGNHCGSLKTVWVVKIGNIYLLINLFEQVTSAIRMFGFRNST